MLNLEFAMIRSWYALDGVLKDEPVIKPFFNHVVDQVLLDQPIDCDQRSVGISRRLCGQSVFGRRRACKPTISTDRHHLPRRVAMHVQNVTTESSFEKKGPFVSWRGSCS